MSADGHRDGAGFGPQLARPCTATAPGPCNADSAGASAAAATRPVPTANSSHRAGRPPASPASKSDDRVEHGRLELGPGRSGRRTSAMSRSHMMKPIGSSPPPGPVPAANRFSPAPPTPGYDPRPPCTSSTVPVNASTGVEYGGGGKAVLWGPGRRTGAAGVEVGRGAGPGGGKPVTINSRRRASGTRRPSTPRATSHIGVANPGSATFAAVSNLPVVFRSESGAVLPRPWPRLGHGPGQGPPAEIGRGEPGHRHGRMGIPRSPVLAVRRRRP